MEQPQNAVFVITEENRCPLYSVGDEIALENGVLTFPMAKSTCLSFVEALFTGNYDDNRDREKYESQSALRCKGCDGYVHFEVKKLQTYVTRQMRMLEAVEKKEKLKENSHFAFVLRELEVFSVLTDDDLLDITALFQLREYPWQFPIVQKGDLSARFNVLISGGAEVISDEGIAVAQLSTGDIFGEMSLLSGSAASSSVVVTEPCTVAEMSRKDFNSALERFPGLHKLFYKLMVQRLMEMNELHAEEKSQSMTGQLSEVHPIELCQLINSGQKTGVLKITGTEDRAEAIFNKGELVSMNCSSARGREGLAKMLTINIGKFVFSSGLTPAQRTLDPVGHFMSLLLECLQEIDDKNDLNVE